MVKSVCFSSQPLLLDGLKRLVEDHPSVESCATVRSLNGLVEKVREERPDLLVIDWSPELSWAALAEICGQVPGKRVILLARELAPELAFQARESGVAAIMDTRCEPPELANVIERVLAGELVYDQGLDLREGITRAVRLTKRQGQLVALLAQGLKNKEIASALRISEGTVKVYFSKLFQKVGAKDRYELALYGLRNLSRPEDTPLRELTRRRPRWERTGGPQGLQSLAVAGKAVNQ